MTFKRRKMSSAFWWFSRFTFWSLLLLTLCRLFYIAVLRCVLRLASRRYSRERNPIGCDGVEDNKPSPQNRECAFTEISTRGDFYAFFRRHRSDARRKKLATMSPIGTESAKNLFCAHLGVSQNRLWRSWETRVCSRFHRAIFPLTFVRWFDPSEGRIFLFLSDSFSTNLPFCSTWNCANSFRQIYRFWTVKKWSFILLLILTAYSE